MFRYLSVYEKKIPGKYRDYLNLPYLCKQKKYGGLMTYQEFLTKLKIYDTMIFDSGSDGEKRMLTKKKENEILDFLADYHTRKISQATGKYTGYWQTRVGSGRKDSRLIRAKTLEELLNILLNYYGLTSPVKKGKSRVPTLDEYFPQWLEWKTERSGNKPHTSYHNEVDFKTNVSGTPLSAIPIDKITTEDLDDWARSVLLNKPMTSKRFNTIRIVVTGPLELAVRKKLISTSPWIPHLMDFRRLFKTQAKAPASEKMFFPGEISFIIDKCLKDYVKNRNSANIAIIINFDLGLRVGELAALMWEDVDWERNLISIRRQENSSHEIEQAVKSDSSAGYRSLPINEYVRAFLHKLQEDSGYSSGYIFRKKNGERLTKTAIGDRFIYVQRGKDDSIPVKRIHCQRRTVGTRIAENLSPENARIWLGHTNLQTTLGYIYTNYGMDDMMNCSAAYSSLKPERIGHQCSSQN